MLIYHCQYCTAGKDCMKAVATSPGPSKCRIGEKEKKSIIGATPLVGKRKYFMSGMRRYGYYCMAQVSFVVLFLVY